MKKTSNLVDDTIRKNQKEALIQDLGIAIFLAGLFASAAVLAKSPETDRIENMVMFFVMCGGIILAAYKFRYIAVVWGGIQTCFFAVYKIYQVFFQDHKITWYSYAWLALPMVCILAMILFMQSTYRAETMAEILEKQVREMIVIDSVTGLYNLKSMYQDLERQMAYARRNDVKLSLMIVQLRYAPELKNILNARQFDELKKRMAEHIEDAIRLEDRIYTIDENGSIGIICNTDKIGTTIMKGRIQEKLLEKDSFADILNRPIKVEIRAGAVEYDQNSIRNSIEFKKKVDNEMQYDV